MNVNKNNTKKIIEEQKKTWDAENEKVKNDLPKKNKNENKKKTESQTWRNEEIFRIP
jgi:hypothetical protein